MSKIATATIGTRTIIVNYHKEIKESRDDIGPYFCNMSDTNGDFTCHVGTGREFALAQFNLEVSIALARLLK